MKLNAFTFIYLEKNFQRVKMRAFAFLLWMNRWRMKNRWFFVRILVLCSVVQLKCLRLFEFGIEIVVNSSEIFILFSPRQTCHEKDDILRVKKIFFCTETSLKTLTFINSLVSHKKMRMEAHELQHIVQVSILYSIKTLLKMELKHLR
jgi:hypothetical protein